MPVMHNIQWRTSLSLVTASFNDKEPSLVMQVSTTSENQEEPVWASDSQYEPSSLVMHNNQ